MTSAIRPAVDTYTYLYLIPTSSVQSSAVASCLWDPESEMHYEDLIISDIMETGRIGA